MPSGAIYYTRAETHPCQVVLPRLGLRSPKITRPADSRREMQGDSVQHRDRSRLRSHAVALTGSGGRPSLYAFDYPVTS